MQGLAKAKNDFPGDEIEHARALIKSLDDANIPG